MPSKLYIAYEGTKEIAELLKEIGTGGFAVIPVFEHLLPSVDTNPIRKIILQFRHFLADSEPEILSEIARLPVYLNVEKYKALSRTQRSMEILRILHGSLLSISNIFGWDTRPFDEVCLQIEKGDCVFSGYSAKSKANPAGTYLAQVRWELFDRLNISVEIRNKHVERVPLTSLSQRSIILNDIIGVWNWENDRTIKIFHANRRDYWRVDVEELTADFHHVRAESGDPHGQYDLGMLFLNGHHVPRSAEQALYWIQLAARNNYGHAIKMLDKLLKNQPSGDGVSPV